MYGDTTTMRKRAGQLREQGTDVRALADRLMAQVAGLSWTGRAAVDMRARIQDRAALLRDCASQHENAAESLERHLAEIDRLKDSIDGTERRARSLLADDAQLRDQFSAPPPGHKAWLTVNLPGL
jgi:predicted phage gp36 major capsid-like protein